MNIRKDRRIFLKKSLVGAAGLSAYSLLTACTSFDEYLFDDLSEFKNEVVIVGGGVAGLYLARKLRTARSEFRLFEGSAAFGGRVRSNGGFDYGASLLSNKDALAGQLVAELGLEKKSIDRDSYYLVGGLQGLTDTMLERMLGLMPYRNFRLRWKLVEIEKISSGFQVVFEHPAGQKKYKCRKLALAIPPTQWGRVRGLLDLPEMKWAASWLETMRVENTIKLVLPAQSAALTSKPVLTLQHDNLNLRQVVKKAISTVEIDIDYLSENQVTIDHIYGVLKRKLQISYPFQKLGTDQYYDWQQANLIQGSHFRNFLAVPEQQNQNFQILGDFTPVKSIYRLEGALESALLASENLI